MVGGQTGRPIAGAELTVVSGANRNARVNSDAGGRYLFTDLEEGRFTVTIAARGFATATPVVDLYHDVDATFALTPLK